MRKHLVSLAFVLTAGNSASSAQMLSIGAIGGVRLTEPIQNGDESRRYIVGPSVEVRLFGRFAVEADALYQRLGDTTAFTFSLAPGMTSVVNRERANSWEFPLLGKYYFRPRTENWQPFAGTGYVFRTISSHSDETQTNVDASGTASTSTFHDDFRSGLGIGASVVAGVRFQRGRFAFLPQVRYTRWGESLGSVTSRNEAGVMLGLTF